MNYMFERILRERHSSRLEICITFSGHVGSEMGVKYTYRDKDSKLFEEGYDLINVWEAVEYLYRTKESRF